MATGFRVLGYADLDIAYAFIRDCEAEGNEGVCPETYGTHPANGVTRAQLPIQHRDRGYLTEDEIIDMIDARASDARRGEEIDAAEDDPDAFPALEADGEVKAPRDDTDAGDHDVCGQIASAAQPVYRLERLPSRIGSRRELYRLGIDLFEKRSRLPSNRSWKDSTRRRKQFLRHLERLLNQMFPET